MDETAALRQLVTKCEAQISRQCATITALQQENRRLLASLSAREALDVLGPEVDVDPAPLPEVPDTIGGWCAWLDTIFARARRQN